MASGTIVSSYRMDFLRHSPGMNYDEADIILASVIKRLREERERQGLSLQKFGELAGVSRTAIGMIEKGQRSPSLTICLRLADALGLRLGNLLNKAQRS
jgi:DNA-binding XRE family transcriptional regulator